jgi:hypothetical protein
VRGEPVVKLAKSCTPPSFPKGSATDCTITMQNTTFDNATFNMTDKLPNELKLVKNSVVNGTGSGNTVSAKGTLAGAQAPIVSIASVPGSSPAGYLPLSIFGTAPIAGMGDETITNFNVPNFLYGGTTYSRIGVVSDGYVVVGGGTGADVQFINQNLPDPAAPNNVLAPFWTDLNPGAGGAIRITILTDGVSSWIVIDFDAVKEFSTTRTNSFEIWIGINGTEDITFTYGTLQGNGDGGFMTAGAENFVGTSGQNYYVDGIGTLPTSTTELKVSTVPGVPGETRTVSFKVTGAKAGAFTNYAQLTSDLFQGINVASFKGTVTP